MYRYLCRRGQERSAAFPLVLNVRPGGGLSLGRFTAVGAAPFWNRGKIHNPLFTSIVSNPDLELFPKSQTGFFQPNPVREKKSKQIKNCNFIFLFALTVKKSSLDCSIKSDNSWLIYLSDRLPKVFFIQFPNML